jgi:hypothetical protein
MGKENDVPAVKRPGGEPDQSPTPNYYFYLFYLALQPSAGYGLLVQEVS